MDNKKFKDTLLLPKTTFPLKNFNPSGSEKKIRELWEERQVYQKLLNSNQNNPSFILHSGPAYANGKIHLGHVLNNTIKDVIVRFWALQGKYTPFLLGWDTHGLPIEHKVLQFYKGKGINLRQLCENFALEQVEIQREQLKKLGLFTDYNKYYITLDKSYEAEQIRIFGELVKKGLVYQGFRPIYWSCGHETALAENEIEYLEKKDTSLYFKIKLVENSKFFEKNVSLLVWTTQPWTIPANQLIAIKKSASYALIKWDDEYLIILEERVSLLEKWDEKKIKVEKVFLGEELLGLSYLHPYCEDIKGYVVSGDDFIQEDEGTGIVHLAPAFGAEDFVVAQKEKLIVECPMETNGQFNEKIGIPELISKHYSEVNTYVISDLTERKLIAKKEEIIHSYPHDWRDKSPLIYRLTKQWFISVQKIKNQLLENIEKVKWYPPWTKEKMISVMTARNDWCLSRQRKWGVPIPVLYHNDEPILEAKIIDYIAELVSEKGSECYFDGEILPFLQEKFPQLISEKTILGRDTMDVWFDSGVSHWCVLK